MKWISFWIFSRNIPTLATHRGQPNRGYKKPNPNPNILSTIFGSYNRGRIVQKGIRFIRNRGRIVQKGIRFIRNRIDDLNRIIRLSRISGFCSRILTELFGWTEYWVISFKYQQARLAKKDTSYVCNPRVQNQNKPNPPICLKHLLTMY